LSARSAAPRPSPSLPSGSFFAVGRYDVGAYIWIEGAFVIGTVFLAVLLFSKRARRPLSWFVPLFRKLRIERPLRSVYEAIHAVPQPSAAARLGLRADGRRPGGARARDLGGRTGSRRRPLAEDLLRDGAAALPRAARPFTINGIAVRESFFVSFLGGLGVDPDRAFATGFLFFVVTITISIPGALILGWENIRRRAPRADPVQS
jgi:hypothetical protein